MRDVQIAEVEILPTGELLVRPAGDPTGYFKYVWRAGAEVNWDETRKSFVTPRPKEWSYSTWFAQILWIVRSELAVTLSLTPQTVWANISPEIQAQMHAEAFRFATAT
jgi:Integron Cassette Protein Hfx_Cass5